MAPPAEPRRVDAAATDRYDRASERLSDIGAVRKATGVLERCAETLREDGRPEEARERIDEAVVLAEEAGLGEPGEELRESSVGAATDPE